MAQAKAKHKAKAKTKSKTKRPAKATSKPKARGAQTAKSRKGGKKPTSLAFEFGAIADRITSFGKAVIEQGTEKAGEFARAALSRVKS